MLYCNKQRKVVNYKGEKNLTVFKYMIYQLFNKI